MRERVFFIAQDGAPDRFGFRQGWLGSQRGPPTDIFFAYGAMGSGDPRPIRGQGRGYGCTPGVVLSSFVATCRRGCRQGWRHSAAWPGSFFHRSSFFGGGGVGKGGGTRRHGRVRCLGFCCSFILLSVFVVLSFFRARPSRRMCRRPCRHPLRRSFGRSSQLQARPSHRMCRHPCRRPLRRSFGRTSQIEGRASSHTPAPAP